MRRRSRSASFARFRRASASSRFAPTRAALVATILLRSSMAHNNASNASAKRIASAVEVHGKGAFATVNEKVSGAEAVRSFVNARAVTVYVPGFKPSIVNWDSRDSFCLIDCPLLSISVNAY